MMCTCRQSNSDFSGVEIKKRCVNFVCTTSAKRRMGSVTTAVVPHCHIHGDGITSLMVFGVAPDVDFMMRIRVIAVLYLLTRTARIG